MDTVFCDESGNSGSNLIDLPQPLYVLAGVITPEPGEPLMTEILAGLRARHQIGGGELKAQRILARARGWRLLSDLLSRMGEAGCVLTYVVAEKRYAIAGKVIETFTDSNYNKKASPSLLYDANEKQRLAGIAYGLGDPVLFDFAKAYRDRHADGFRRSLAAICDGVRADNPDLADLLHGAEDYIDEIALAEASADRGFPGSAMPSLNLPIFTLFLYRVEAAGRASGGQIIVCHDNSKEFAPTFEYWFNLSRKSGVMDVRLNNDGRILLPFTSLQSFVTSDSEHSAGIQAADLVAGALNIGATNRYLKRAALVPEAEEPLRLLYSATIATPQLAQLVASDRFVKDIVHPIVFDE